MTYTFQKIRLEPQPVLVMRRSIRPAEIAQALTEMFPQVYGYAQQNGIMPAGPPLARYLECLPEQWTVEAGFPVAAGFPVEAPRDVGGLQEVEMQLETLPGGLVATTTHAGPYHQLREAHTAMEQWIRAQGLAIAGPVWESYITDPAQHPDPQDWRTGVFFPLSS